MLEKKGLNNILSIVLLIFLTIVAAGIVYMSIQSFTNSVDFGDYLEGLNLSGQESAVKSDKLSDEVPNEPNYIIQFNEKAVLEVRAEELEKTSNIETSDVKNKVREQETKVLNEHARIKKDFSNLKVKREYKNALNGMAISLNEKDVEKIKSKEYVESISQNLQVAGSLMDSIPAINADDAWELDSNLNSCTYAPRTFFNKTFGGFGMEEGYSILQTSDGGYLLLGSYTDANRNQDAWLIKTDVNGSVVWNKTYGGVNRDEGRSVIQTPDGGYIFAGRTASYRNGDDDAWLVKTDASGNKLWEKNYGGNNYDSAITVINTSSGGYALIGSTNSYFGAVSPYPPRIWLIIVNGTGKIIWDRIYGGDKGDSGVSIVQTSDGYVVLGNTYSFGAGNGERDMWLMKLDPNGYYIWNKTFGGIGEEGASMSQSLVQTQDGGFAFTGGTSSFGKQNEYAMWLVRTDAGGNHLWNKTYEGGWNSGGNSLVKTFDNGFALTGSLPSSVGSGDVGLIRTDSNGTEVWRKIYQGGPGTAGDVGNAIIQTSDEGFALLGYTNPDIQGVWNEMWLIKTGKEIKSECLTGKGVTIGILDSGVDYTHPDLGGCYGGDANEPEDTELPAGCEALQHDGQMLRNHVNLVFVPSGFNGNMEVFRQNAERIWQTFQNHAVFGSSINKLNAFYVTEESVNNNYCYFNCGGISRLLCCDESIAKDLSSICFNGPRQTIVVHNSATYGGAGYMGSDMATTSIHSSAPLIAIHELGHSLFNLHDEYIEGWGDNTGPNCDVGGCSKWHDLNGYNGVGCVPGHCKNGIYYVGEPSIMKELSRGFEEVNERIACCEYKRETGEYPSYCNKFISLGLGLSSYCSTLGGAGMVATSKPSEYQFILQDGQWILKSSVEVKEGFYPSEQVLGEGDGEIAMELSFNDGRSKVLQFSRNIQVEIPGEDRNSLAGYANVERKSITVIVEEENNFVESVSIDGQDEESSDILPVLPSGSASAGDAANCKVIGGYDFVNEDNDPMDDHGHGTHVSGIAAGNGVLKGVAPDAKIVAYKVLGADNYGLYSDLIAAIERSVDPNQDGNFSDHLDVISLSLGGDGNPDDYPSRAIDNAVSNGVVAVVAAGNSGPGGGSLYRDIPNDGSQRSIWSPGTARKAITIGATDKNDLIASLSSRGPVVWSGGELIKPDILAPGIAICSVEWDSAWSANRCFDTRHIYLSGTSMATPHVAGAAALLIQKNPDWTPEEIKLALKNTAINLGYDKNTQGTGRIDVLSAISLNEAPSLNCVNSDVGLNYYLKGTASGIYALSGVYYDSVADYCSSDNKQLTEWYCLSDGKLYQSYYTCPEACVDGACLSVTYSYSAWSACSKTCGGGTQTRTCVRSDGVTVDCSLCGGVCSQSCNTQSCCWPIGTAICAIGSCATGYNNGCWGGSPGCSDSFANPGCCGNWYSATEGPYGSWKPNGYNWCGTGSSGGANVVRADNNKTACDAIAKTYLASASCTIGGGCCISGGPPRTGCPSANPSVYGACIVKK
jgi:subtilisin family serine protease